VAFALSISAICSLMEATLLSLTPSQVAELSSKNSKLGVIWQRFKANVEQPIAVILLLNTAAHTIGASIAGSQFDELFGDEWILAFSLAFTAVMLQFTEILPKSLGVRFNREIAVVIARPLVFMIALCSPLLQIVHWINRPFEGRRRPTEHPATIEEIAALAGLARLSNQISQYQERIIHGASRLSGLHVQEIMIPVEQISSLSTSQSLADAIAAAHIEAHTRFPVFEEGDFHRVAGYVNFKEMIYYMRTNPGDPSLRGIIRPVGFVPPELPASELLRRFVSEHVHLAIVRDSEGKTLGMVTFEDIVEELVGDLEDEFDRLPRMIHPLTGGTWMFGGGTPMSEVAQRLEHSFPKAAGTLSAWLLQKFAHVPQAGETYHEAGFVFIIRRTRRRRIFEVAVQRATR
jgi:putative hemolysin